MSTRQSMAGKSNGAGETNRPSDPSITTITQQCTDAGMVQNSLLIWLDNNADVNNADCRSTITEFKRVINTVNNFTDGDECIKFIEHMNNSKAYLVISGSLGQHIVPRVHDMSQVNSIFIFCGNKKYHEQWTKGWAKIRGVFTEISRICEALKQATQQCEQNAISISFVKTSGSGISFANVDQLDSLFMYSQILKEILLSIQFDDKHFKEFIDYCRRQHSNNNQELKNIENFDREYRNQSPVRWYTYHSFLYSTVMNALRTMEVDVIIKSGFFISDLHRQIEKLHSEQFNGHNSGTSFIVYRGQLIPKADFEQMKKTKGGLMSFSVFLSTSKIRQICLDSARRTVTDSDSVGILFTIKIDPVILTAPFASISGISCDSAEDEVLFSMHTVFRIGDIKPLDDSQRLFQVDLILTGDTDEELRMLTDHLRKEICYHSNGWYQLGLFLLKMGQFDKAQRIYEDLLKQTSDERETGNLYHQLGLIKADQGKHQEAITFYEKAVKICEKTLPPNHPHLASSYTNLGSVYNKIDDYQKALAYHEKALQIYQKIRPPNHPDLCSTYKNIGLVYNNMGEHPKALSFHEKSLEIQQKTLPENHPDLAASYHNFGLVYDKMKDYSKAISYYNRAVDIGQRSLPVNHSDLQMYKKNLDLAKKKL